ncbi:MAG: ABC transporter permease [Bacteroidales bacterium]|jgi:putative ABC transport system permease protein
MNYSNLFRIALNALLRNKVRAFLTMLGVIIGVASVIAMLGIGQGSKKSIEDEVSGMGANMIMVFPGSMQRGGVSLGNSDAKALTLDDMEAIRQDCPSVQWVSPEVRGSGQAVAGNENNPTTIFGVNQEYLSIKTMTVKSGRIFSETEIKTSSKVCLLGQTVVKELFGEGADPVGATIRFKNIPFRVIGILSAKGQSQFGQDQDNVILAPYTTIQKRILAIPHIQGIYASAISETASPIAVTEMETVLRKRHGLKETDKSDFEVRSQEELVSTFSSISNVLTILLGAIAGISLLVGGIGIMNIMYVSVTERTREIGLRMSIGGRGTDILLQFLTESILISVLGGILGILLGIGASALLGKLMNWPIEIMPQAVILSFLVCSFIGIFFGWYPARKAASLDPIDALRYE